jgi:hypothetical protein
MQREFIITRLGRDYVMYAGLLDAAHRDGLSAIRTTLVQAPSPANGFAAICHAEVVTARGTFTAHGDADPENVPRLLVTALVRMAETRAKARALADAVNVAMTAIEELSDAPADSASVVSPPRSPASRPMLLPEVAIEPVEATEQPDRFENDEARADTREAPEGAPRGRSGRRSDTGDRAPALDPLIGGGDRRPPTRQGRARGTVAANSDATSPGAPTRPATAVSATNAGLPATLAQLDAITRLARALGRTIPTDGLTRTAASDLITQLSADRYPAAPR